MRAAAGRQQADAHLHQADACLVVVDQHAVVAAQRKLEAAAERHAVDGCGDRLAAGLDAAQVHVPVVADLEGLGLGHAAVVRADEVLDVAAGDEAALLARREHGALDCRLGGHAVERRHQLDHQLGRGDVHRARRVVEHDQRDAVGIDGERERALGHESLCGGVQVNGPEHEQAAKQRSG